jgi:hypothetical protein
MAKEKFLIVARELPADCFARFRETANCARIDAGEESADPYSWIEASFEILLIRYREATHLGSLTPNAYAIWLCNEFVGIPNESWDNNPDPYGLERESGRDDTGEYIEYRDDYDERFVCESFTLDTMRDLPEPMRKPREPSSVKVDRYHDAIWTAAEEATGDLLSNGASGAAPILGVYAYRQWRRELALKARERAAELSRIRFKQGIL